MLKTMNTIWDGLNKYFLSGDYCHKSRRRLLLMAIRHLSKLLPHVGHHNTITQAQKKESLINKENQLIKHG